MNRQQAKLILAAYRPNGADASDPRFAEALDVARNDPELAAWFARQRRFDSAVAAKLNSLMPPPELRDLIAVGLRFERRRKKWRWLLAAAAMFALGTAAIVTREWRSRESFTDAGLIMFATNYVANGIALQNQSNDSGKIEQWLVAQHAPLPASLPLDQKDLRSLGCRTLSFQGRTLTLLCFENGREFHLFIARRSDFPQVAPEIKPRLQSTAAGWCAAEWSDMDHVFVLVSDASPSELQQYLRPPAGRAG